MKAKPQVAEAPARGHGTLRGFRMEAPGGCELLPGDLAHRLRTASAAHLPVDAYTYGFEEATKQLTESLTDLRCVVPDGQGAGCLFSGACSVVKGPMAWPHWSAHQNAAGREEFPAGGALLPGTL